MFRVPNRFVAVCLLAVWLVATQHCALEAAGLLGSHESGTGACCAGHDSQCTQDACDLVENGGYQSNVGSVKVPLPQFVLVRALTLTPPLKVSASSQPRDYFVEPLDWLPSWQFVRRAAALAHAPDALIA